METIKMRYYVYRPDANNFAGIAADLTADERVTGIHYEDRSLSTSWTPVTFHGFDDNPPEEGDFPSLSNFWRIPVFSQRAWDALHTLVGYCCEALPIIHPTGKPFYIIHVMETIDCLDEARSELTRNPVTNRVSRIFRYALKTNRLRGKHIFKLPRESGAELLVDDVFRKAVEDNDLKGLIFKELPRID